MKTQTIEINKDRDAFMEAYLLETKETNRNKGPFPAVIILPGGGFNIIADMEGEPVAFAFLKGGYSAFVLHYSVNQRGARPGNGAWPNPLEDYETAIRYIKDHAKEMEIDADRIAVCGFSAGGALAGAAATIAENKPKAVIVGYGVLCGIIDEERLKAGFKEDVDKASRKAVDGSEYVSKNTPPCFLFATANDNVVPVANTIKFASALAENKVPFEMHIYSEGPHAFSTGDKAFGIENACPRIGNWVGDALQWLRETM